MPVPTLHELEYLLYTMQKTSADLCKHDHIVQKQKTWNKKSCQDRQNAVKPTLKTKLSVYMLDSKTESISFILLDNNAAMVVLL